MPTPELMTWVPSQRRWTRMHKSKRFYVSCRQLGTAETKEASRQAANEWWRAKQAELDAANQPAPRTPQPLEDIAAAFAGHDPAEFFDKLRREYADWLREWVSQHGGEYTDEAAREFAENHLTMAVRDAARQIGHQIISGGEALPTEVAENIPPARVHQVENAVKELRGEATAQPERAVKAHAERWVKTQQAKAATGSLAPDRADNNRIALEHFTTFLGAGADVATIDAARLHNFYLWCLQKAEARHRDEDRKAGWSGDYAKKVFDTARTFIRFLWEGNLIELPRNIDSRSFRFGNGAKAVPTWTAEEVQHVIGEAPGQLKLHLLLMVNCAYTQADISDLRDDEVDWTEGRIIRKRSKTADRANVPVVSYKLWPLTFELLQKYRSGTERVLLTEKSGKPFVRKELVNGRLKKSDNIASNYAHLKRRLKFRKPLKQLRKTVTTMLEGHKDYGRFKDYFLGHSPRTVADRHYAAPSKELFDEAVAWLGRQLGQVNRPARRSRKTAT